MNTLKGAMTLGIGIVFIAVIVFIVVNSALRSNRRHGGNKGPGNRNDSADSFFYTGAGSTLFTDDGQNRSGNGPDGNSVNHGHHGNHGHSSGGSSWGTHQGGHGGWDSGHSHGGGWDGGSHGGDSGGGGGDGGGGGGGD